MKVSSIILVCAIVVCAASLVSAVGCIDENGKSVDWFLGLKGPQIKESSDARIQAGLMYQYGDANSFKSSSSFTLSANKLDGPNSAFSRTVQQTYAAVAASASSKNALYVFYNDEVPATGINAPFSAMAGKTCDAEGAHSKGMLHLDATSKTGYWLIHSMPNVAVPPSPTKAPTFNIPDSAVIYGQSFICMSIDMKNADLILKQFTYHNPNVYGQQFPDALKASMPNAAAFFAGTRVKTPGAASLSVATLTTVGGQAFTHFGKARQWGMDLYRDAIATHYNQPLAVETWMRPLEPSYTPPKSKLYVVNVQSTSMIKAGPSAVLTWTEEEDHSKWAISLGNTPVTCIGDINKQESQWGRGGGSACIQNDNVHKAFVAAVGMVDKYTPAGPVPSGGAIPPSTAQALKGGKAPAAPTPAPKTTPAKTKTTPAKTKTTPAKTKTTTTTTTTTTTKKSSTAKAPAKRATKTVSTDAAPAPKRKRSTAKTPVAKRLSTLQPM